VLNELLLEAKKNYMDAEEHAVSIYVSDTNNSWRHVASRPKRNIVRNRRLFITILFTHPV
jgi:hypothetical protein